MHSRVGILASAAALLGAALSPGTATARAIQVYNNADFAMVQLQAKPTGTPVWGGNLIGRYSLGVGKSQAATLPNEACAQDFLATYGDGHKTQRLAVGVCKPGAIEFN
jgi:hypothetical protein